ncbi:MAG: hypothetical protein JNJ88_17965 [Planctomycetes bacterium]|nr:hypothetical protein [Planctomycetota bacterium]
MSFTTRFAIGASSLALAALCFQATAQTPQIVPFAKTADLLIGDNFTSKILRCSDLTADGDYDDAGEVTLYFDPAVALDPNTGLPYGAAKMGNPLAMAVDMMGWVYVADGGTTRTLFRIRDVDGDGDANDAGESSIFFDPANAAGINNFALQGVIATDTGHIYATIAGQGSGFTTIDRLVKLIDSNGDGDANDAGEQAIVWDRATAVTNGNTSLDSPAWIGTLPDGTLYISNGNANNQGIWRLADQPATPDGIFNDAGEVTHIYGGANGNPPPKFTFCARFGQDGRMYLVNITDKRIIAATDVNANGIYDDAGEAAAFATSGDGGITISAMFGVDVRDDGTVVLGDTGGSPNNRLIGYKDLNFNGVASDPGEQTVLLSFNTTTFPTAKARSLQFLPREPKPFGVGRISSSGSFLGFGAAPSGGLPKVGNPNFALQVVQAPIGVQAGLFYSDVTNPIPFTTLAPGLSDPNSLLYPDVFNPGFGGQLAPGLTDVFGTGAFPLPIPPLPSLAGKTFTVQGFVIDFASLFPIVFSNALELTFL